jgi:nucleotide-binding universal stress UspA family protein
MRTILVPLDGSAFGEHALPVAVAIARRSGASLTLIHAHQLIVQSIMLAEASYFDLSLDTLLREQEKSYLDEVAQRLAATWDGQVIRALLEAPVDSALNSYAREHEVSLIVMCSHGRGGAARAWLGSVADRLVRHTTTPLVIVRPHDGEPTLAAEPALQHILIPLDGSPLAEQAVELALRVGRPFQARYTLLQVVAPILRGFLVGGSDPEVDAEAEAAAWQRASDYLAGIAARLRDEGCEVHAEALIGSPASAILDYAQTYDADLIAMTTHGRGGVARLLVGSVADKVLRGANVPVLIERPPEPLGRDAG